MEDLIENQEINSKEPMPVFLKVLCILSYIGVGLTIIPNLVRLLMGPYSEEEMLQQKVIMTELIEKMEDMGSDFGVTTYRKMIIMTENLNTHFYASTGLIIVGALIGLYGVIQMWQRKKIGFHFYIVYSILAISQVYFFVSPVYVPTFILIWNVFISGLFVFMYSRNLKWMN